MNPPRWTLWTVAILLAGCLIGLDAYWHWHDAGARTRDALLSAMPSEASAVLFADLAELRRSPFAAELYNWIPKGQVDAEYAQFLRATGFDYERDLDRAAIAVVKDENENKLFAVAEGRFDRQKIEAYASKSGTHEIRGGRKIFSVTLNESARKISFAFLSKDEMALTDAPDLVPLLAPSRNSADARDWQERFARVAGSPVFAILRQDAAAGNALASRTPGGFQSPQFSMLLNQLQWISLAAKPEEGALRIVAEGESANEQTSRQLSDLLSGMLLLARAGLNGPQTRQQLDPQVRDAYLEMVKSAAVSRLDRGETKSVRLVFDVTPKFLSAVSMPVPAAPAPAIPASKTPAPKARSQKPVRN
ncbi:MAG TPA: hypothetical protein VNY81_06445 [Candidatus Saccharimonadales bacterium]|jgi:hypothetical protein|nr:hypothetical protein [Candidatus Saccharimonadales bacterium]